MPKESLSILGVSHQVEKPMSTLRVQQSPIGCLIIVSSAKAAEQQRQQNCMMLLLLLLLVLLLATTAISCPKTSLKVDAWAPLA